MSFANLQGAKLLGANLQGAHLSFPNLQGANLSGANLQGANLSSADLQEANLSEANLHGVNLSGANLHGVDLSGANLHGARLWSVSLQGARLWGINLQGARLYGANLQEADLFRANLQGASLWDANLQGVDLLKCKSITHIYLENARLDHTRLRQDQLGEAIGEELAAEKKELPAQQRAKRYASAKHAYLALKQNFDDLGDYNASSWAYIKERKMEKWEAFYSGSRGKFIADQLTEWVSLYGEGPWRVIISLVIVWLGFALIYGLTYGVWGPWQEIDIGRIRYITTDPIDLLSFSLGAMVTHPPTDLEARSIWFMRVLMPLEALLGIFLAGLLGFVAGNRIRRS
jgi:uncharacterized protein YjbI with pentapeptide repeats